MDIKQFLDLVQNADTYKSYLKELDEREKNIRALIELQGKAADIPTLYERAKKEVEAAKAEGVSITTSASKRASAVMEEAKKIQLEAQALMDRVLVDNASLKAEKKALQERETLLAVKEKEVDSTQERISAYEKSLSLRDAEMSEKLAKINSVLR